MKANTFSKIQDFLDEVVENHKSAGINCLIIQDGIERAYFESGYMDVENKTPLQRDSIFRLYSMSKTITAAATMILVERGVIDLFENVSNYIPSFANPMVSESDGSLRKASREVRIGDLLSMTSGLTYPGDANEAYISANKILNEVIEKIDTQNALSTFEVASMIGASPLSFDPGSHYEYGLSADVLGAVIEVATGMKYSDFLTENIFAPLEMNDIGFYVPENKQNRLAKLYTCKPNDFELYTFDNLGVSNKLTKAPAFESGGAGLCSTIDDFVPFSQMLLNGGTYNGVKIMSPETVKYLTTYRLTGNLQREVVEHMPHLAGYSYGNLLRVMVSEHEAVTLGCNGEYGWDGWTGTYFANDPANKLTILSMRQKVDCGTDDVTRRLRNLIYSSL